VRLTSTGRPKGVTSKRTEEYRRQADDARKRAEAADNDWVRENWLRLAKDWEKLARSVEAEEAPLERHSKVKHE
jgi:hypothetical protein